MSSLALYRRYRPETFAEVIGQEHVTEPLQQALRNNRVNHAYLFSGPRGCGKTTSARILARCLNCEQGPTPSPCGECRSCLDLARNGPGSIDVIEIDAASHGGVDDARELREKAFFGPASSRYKIYIVDEAHMVTSAGFNALLKVVEEPPEHLKFIFATTEPEKVIGTIRSRTHHYPFRLVPPGTLREYLAEVCRREEIAVDEAVLPLAVRAGAGSVRDSMSVMDQLLAGAGEEGVTYAMATALLGYTDSSLLDSVVDAFAAGDGAAAFEVVEQVVEGGHDPRRFVADLLERLRDLVILASVPEAGEKGLIDAPPEVAERMQAQASVFGQAELSRAADLVNSGLTEMRGATSPRLQLELICARVLLPAAYGDERSVQARLDRLERGAALGAATGAPAPAPGAAAPAAAAPNAPTPAAPADVPAPEAASAPPPPAPAPQPPPPAPESAPAGAAGAAGTEQGRRPGAWPTAAPGGGRRPGAWPGGTGPGERQGAGQPDAAPGTSAPPQAPAPSQPSPAPQAGGPAAGGPAGDPSAGAAQVRQAWPNVLEAVKNRRRFTWILLSQNANIVGFDGTTLQIGFPNSGARDSFTGGGSDEVLRQALGDALGVQWKVEAVVDPGGGSGGPQGGGQSGGGPQGGGRPGAPSGGFGGPAAPASQPAGGFGGPSTPPGPAASPASGGAPPPGGAASGSGTGQATAARSAPPAQARAPEPEPEPEEEPPPSAYVDPADDMPTADDPDLDETALSGHDLIIKQLGATVIEEYQHE
ncbi:DNA polymerase III subunit gamma and tau [Streptomyces sulphureus]|uniref:DNA polymerase III subunit gamma and tau n=1 Tax=Streptomyces sulphureus TaxID=47758 RepID=UPI0003740471|nr:DNA polymerase III subunit gamma and tau [Streptomyces sulphureus]